MPTFLSANLDTSWFTPADNRDMVPRIRLLEELHHHRSKKLRAVIAPSGGGKTTLLQQYYSLYPDQTAWLTLQDVDRSAICFFHHLATALKRVSPDLNGPVLCQEFSTDSIAPYLFFDLFFEALSELESPITVIIDNGRCLRDISWHSQFLELIKSSPNIHWIIAGNSRKTLLGEAFAIDDMFLLTQDNLYFKPNELRVFLSKNAAHQSFNDLVIKITHGWPAGIKLAQLCLNYFAPKVCDLNMPSRELFNFLVDHLIDHLDSNTSGFLMQTAFLNRFNEALCQSYVKAGRVTQSLQILRDTRFLLEIDPEHPLCYHYSPLVKERLLERFSALDANEREPLVSSACRWLVENDHHIDAMMVAHHHPDTRVQTQFFLKNLVFWLRSGNLQSLYQDHVANHDSALNDLAQARMAWCWLLNMSGHLKESALELKALTAAKSIEDIILSPQDPTEANCAVAYGIILSQQKRLGKNLVDNLKLLTKHPEVYTSLRATLYSLLAEVEVHRFHAREAQHYISLSKETSDELSYEFNFSISQQIEARLYYFNGDPKQALATLQKAMSRHWQYPSAIGKASVSINFGYLLYRINDRQAGYRICLAECFTLLPWMHIDTQFMAYQILSREAIRRKQPGIAKAMLTFLDRVSCSSGSDRYYAQTVLEQFRLAVILGDSNWAQSLAENCFLPRQITECLEPTTELDWISQLSWLMAGVFYYRLVGEWGKAQGLVQQLLYLNVESGFPIHFLTISVLELWLEFYSGSRNSAFLKLSDLLSKTSGKDLHLGLFDDIPGSEHIIHKALVDNHITNTSYRTALLDLGFGVLDH